MYDKELSAAEETQPAVLVLDANWRALIKLNKLMSQEQLEILSRLSVLATKADTEQVLKTVRSEQRDTIAMVLSISLDTFYSNKNYAARKI